HPDLPTADRVPAIVEASDGLLICGIRSSLLLRERERTKRRTRRPPTQPALFLRFASELGDRLGDERIVDRGDNRENGTGFGHGLDGQRVAHIVPARTAPCGRN